MGEIEMQKQAFFLFLKKVLIFFPLITVIAVVNFFTFRMSEDGEEKKYASLLLQGKNLSGKESPFAKLCFNQRLLQKSLIEECTTVKDVIVLGSSRSRQISLTPFLGRYASFFNYSVNASVLEDMVALYGLIKKRRKRLPSVVVVECSDFFLNKNYQRSPDFAAIEDGYDYLVQQSSFFDKTLKHKVKSTWSQIHGVPVFHFYDLFSFEGFQAAVKKMLKEIIYGCENKSEEEFVWFSDGHRFNQRQESEGVMRTILTQTEYSALDGFYELDSIAKSLFEAFVGTMLFDGVHVVFFFPPYHPIAYKKILSNNKYKMVGEAQAFFLQCAAKYGLEVFGIMIQRIVGVMNLTFMIGSIHMLRRQKKSLSMVA